MAVDNYPITVRTLRHGGTLYKRVSTGTDDRGQPQTSWLRIADVRMRIKPLGVTVVDTARQFFESATHEILIRYRKDVTRETKVTSGTRTFYVGHVENIRELNRWLRLLCTEEL